MKHVIAIFAVSLSLLQACSGTKAADGPLQLVPFVVESTGPSTLLRGSTLVIKGSGFLPNTLVTYYANIDVAGNRYEFAPIVRIDENTLHYQIADAVIHMLPKGQAFDMAIRFSRRLTETGQVDSFTHTAQFQVADNLEPTLLSFDTEDGIFYPGDIVSLSGTGFLLAGEGHTVVELSGTFKTKVPPETRSISKVFPLNGVSRSLIELELTPDILGIRPGQFNGQINVSNETTAGQRIGVGLLGISRDLRSPYIDLVAPNQVSRGQRIVLTGRGFLATDPFHESSTLIRLEGEFEVAKTSAKLDLDGPSAMALFPDFFDSNRTMEYVLRVSQTPGGEQTGLGLTSGRFNGNISPVLISGAETVIGQGVPIQLTISPQRQIVHVNFLPGFSDTVAEMGLSPVEAAIQNRVIEVCKRDYQGISIEFRLKAPVDFVEYSVIEVGGPDPNQANLFGLDNTKGKDVGNLRFNDIIGGTNAETAKQGYYAYGGVFVRSFYQLSPSIPGIEPLPIASKRFDDIFGPFMPALGGREVLPQEVNNSPRSYMIAEAVRVLGNLVGTTVVHEVGHSLGLSNIDGEYHNIGDNPGWIMDSGTYRPFNERAEIDGTQPGYFSPNNRKYLEKILPLQ